MSNFPDSLNADFISAWLALPTLDEQIAHLEMNNLLTAEGLGQMVEWAGRLVRQNPAQARELTTICLNISQMVNLPAIFPRATYLKAQTHALAGEFETALNLVHAAHTAYLDAGQETQALTTQVGLMHILAESGQYETALATGQAILDRLGTPPPPEATILAAQISQNMGLCSRRLGKYEAALQAYQTAEAYYQAQGLSERAGDISNNRGVLLLELGRATEALAALETALALRTATGQIFLQGQTLNNLGSVHLLLGNFHQSLTAFEQARQLFATQDATLDHHILLLDTAHAYLTLNLYPEASTAYREAETLLNAAGATHHRALALWGLGATLYAQEAWTEASEVLESAISLLQNTPTPLLVTVLLEKAAVQSALGFAEQALGTCQQALQMATEGNWLVPSVYAHLRLSDFLLPDLAQAEAHLLAAQPGIETLNLPQLRYRWLERMGRIRRQQGLDSEAQTYLEAAINEIERLRNTLAQETLRASFLQDKIMAYRELVQIFLNRGDLASLQQAFAVTEQAKSRALVDLMNGIVTAQVAAQSEFLQQLQQLQADLNALYNNLLNTDPEGGRQIRYIDTHAQAIHLEQAINRLQLQITASQPLPELFHSLPSLSNLSPQLPSDVALVSYYEVGNDLLAFIFRAGKLEVIRPLCRMNEVENLLGRLNTQWGRFRVGAEFVAQHLSTLAQAVQRLLGRLYQLIFAPIEPHLANFEKVTIIPHSVLHHLPFHALFDGQDYLLERFEITYAPSATVFSLCQNRLPAQVSKTVIIGVSDPLIPAVREEVAAVAEKFPNAEVYLDECANLEVMQSQTSKSARLHLACHGLFRADNPMFSALKLHDGWFTATQALQLDLAGALVTLSGCETGRSQIIHGDEILGLTRSFLGAGASTLVVSLWLVQDKTTATLMATLYEHLQQGNTPASALRQAQRLLKASHPHPYYWAPFILVGQRNSASP
ncbi:MAG: CHAT domain-containing protein [Anaerolineales bacterium]